jgi:hypothetical protein
MSSPSKIAKILVQAVARTGELEEVILNIFILNVNILKLIMFNSTEKSTLRKFLERVSMRNYIF